VSYASLKTTSIPAALARSKTPPSPLNPSRTTSVKGFGAVATANVLGFWSAGSVDRYSNKGLEYSGSWYGHDVTSNLDLLWSSLLTNPASKRIFPARSVIGTTAPPTTVVYGASSRSTLSSLISRWYSCWAVVGLLSSS